MNKNRCDFQKKRFSDVEKKQEFLMYIDIERIGVFILAIND